MSWWSYFGYTAISTASDPAISTDATVLARRSKLMSDLLLNNVRRPSKYAFIERIRSLLSQIDRTKGRENKIPIAMEIFDYMVAHRMTFWKYGYSEFPKTVLLKIYEFQKEMDLSLHYKKLFPRAPPLDQCAEYSEKFIPNVAFFTND